MLPAQFSVFQWYAIISTTLSGGVLDFPLCSEGFGNFAAGVTYVMAGGDKNFSGSW